jgi:hypothetical protein
MFPSKGCELFAFGGVFLFASFGGVFLFPSFGGVRGGLVGVKGGFLL